MTDPILTELRLIRLASGRSQQEVADTAGVIQSSLSFWERGDRPIRLDTLRKVLDAFGLDLAIVEKEQP